MLKMTKCSIKSSKEFCKCKPNIDYSLLDNALNFAKKAHSGQIRKTGEPFIEHPIAVAKKLCQKYSDINLVCAAFLHDVVEDCENISIEDIYNKFGEDIGFLVDSLNKCEKSFYKYPEIFFESKSERLLWAGIQDIRVLLIKIADREHNLETLNHLKDNKQVRMAFETQAIYEPLKKILHYNKPLCLNDTAKKLENIMLRHKIKNPKELKEYLFKKSFNNFNNESFGVVYRNTDSVIWRVEGMDMYKRLCSTRTLKGKIEIVTVRSNGKWLTVDFKFKKGAIVNPNNKLKLKLFSFKTR